MATNFLIPFLILFATHTSVVISDDTVPIPPDRTQLNTWFQNNVKPFSARKDSLDPALGAAETGAQMIRVSQDGKGDFKTVTDAVNSIPDGNNKRVVIYIGPGTYNEKIKVAYTKPFVTLYGDPSEMPTLVHGDTALRLGTDDSATVIVESDYFVAANLNIENSAPRPDLREKGGQAVALRIAGDKAAVYNCKLHGFQDTLGEDHGKHFYKDCYIEGTVDFIFGSARSLFVNTELHVIPGDNIAVIAAQAGQASSDSGAFSFVHCKVTGGGKIAYLGRAWMPYAKVVFLYTDMSDVVNPEGWSNNFNPKNDKTVYFGEYQCSGPGSDNGKRIGFTKKLTAGEANPYLNLGFIQASKWLLPPPSLNGLKGSS